LIAKELGWTWIDIMDAPSPVIDEFYHRILIEHRMREKKEEIDKQLNSLNSGK